MKIEDIEGIGASYAKKLRKAGVQTVNDLLKKGGSAKGRGELASAAGLTEHQILEWVNRADLYRVHGIGSQYADLLEAAGVDTVAELARRVPAKLMETLSAVNAKKNKVQKLPGVEQVAGWVKEAKSLPRVVKY